MPIDLGNVDWLYVAVLAVFVFISALIGNLLSFNHRGAGAVLAAVAFVVIFVAWTYYPHHLPLPTALATQKAPTVAVPAPAMTPATSPKPRNPVTDVTPPAAPR
jgi:hypothetical protein